MAGLKRLYQTSACLKPTWEWVLMLSLDAVTAGYTDENIIHDISLHM